MNDDTLKTLITNLPAIITALGVIVTAYLSYRSNRQSKANAVQIEEVRQGVNGQSAALLKVTGEAEFAKGMKAEQDAPSSPSGTSADPIHVETKRED